MAETATYNPLEMSEEDRQALGIFTGPAEAPSPDTPPSAPASTVAPPIAPAAPTSTIAPSMTAPPAPAGSAVAPAIGSTADLENKAGNRIQPGAAAGSGSTGDPQADFKKARADAKNATLSTAIGSPEYYQARAKEIELKNANPFGSAGNHPGLAGKIMHGLGVAGNIAGDIFAPGAMGMTPGTQMHEHAELQQDLAGYKDAETEEAKLAKGKAALKSPWKPATGEQFTQYDASGRPTSQLYTNEDTNEQQWRPVPAPGAALVAGGAPAGAPAVAGGAPAAAPAAGSYYGNKEMPKFDEKLVGADNVAQYSGQVENAALRVPEGYDVAKPEITATDTNATANAKLKDYHLAVNNAILADRNDQAMVARETAAETKDRRTEDRKNRATTGYATDADGNLILTNKFDAANNASARHTESDFEEIKPGDVNKDKSAMRQLNDVQKNVNLYTKSIREDLPKLVPGDTDKMQEIMALNQQSGGSVLDVGEKGISIGSIPILGAKLTKQNLKQITSDLAELSPAGRNLLTGYLRTAAAVPAYQKALTGIGRSNKEMLDLELANIPLPYYDNATANNRMKAFQENMDQARNGFPSNLPGMKLTAAEASSGAGERPQGTTHVGTSDVDHKQYYLDKDGNKLGPVN
jgi:hypothetical protein